MKTPQGIIKRLLLTEKSTRLTEQGNQYVFEVFPDANKVEIRRAVEQLFKVNVLEVNTLNRKGVATTGRRFRAGFTSDRKRAVVTLKAGQKIDIT